MSSARSSSSSSARWSKKVTDAVRPRSSPDRSRTGSYDPEAEPGDEIGVKMDTSDFGRILAQAAKQVIIQRIRDAERDQTFDEYRDRQGEIVNGIVRRFEKGAIIVDLGRAEAVLPPKEQVPRESYRPGDRIRAYVLEVNRVSARGRRSCSRAACIEMLTKLFEQEVPEMYEKIVTIESAAREPGGRSKIAVSSRDSDVDPVGACVGMKGSRVQAVVQELRGERIDIVPWSPDAARYVCSALSPAQVSKVIIDEGQKSMDVIVPDDQLSLAIGRRGQNVRLAVQLTGWKIDIKSETKMKRGRRMAVARGLRDRRGLRRSRGGSPACNRASLHSRISPSAPSELLTSLPGSTRRVQRRSSSAAGESRRGEARGRRAGSNSRGRGIGSAEAAAAAAAAERGDATGGAVGRRPLEPPSGPGEGPTTSTGTDPL